MDVLAIDWAHKPVTGVINEEFHSVFRSPDSCRFVFSALLEIMAHVSRIYFPLD